MTDLRNPISRRTASRYPVLYASSAKARQIVVSLVPGDVIEFREHGRRGRFTLPIDAAFRYAVRLNSLNEARIKAAKKKKNKYADH